MCALKQTKFTGDLPVEDNETDRCRSERGRGPLTQRANEVGGGVVRLFAESTGMKSLETKGC